MKLTHILYLLSLSCLLLTSCFSLHSGAYVSSLSLTQPNYKYVKPVSGTVQATYFIGIGGLNKNELMSEAKEKMYANAKLKTNQDIANVVLSEKVTSLFLIAVVKEVTLTGDVIEWNTENTLTPRKQGFYNHQNKTLNNDTKRLKIESYKNCEDKYFSKYKSEYEVKIGAVVDFESSFSYGIITERKGQILTIETYTPEGNSQTHNINFKDVKVLNCH